MRLPRANALLPEASPRPGHFVQPFFNHVVTFVDRLHHAGLKVSPAELIDLCRALQIIDVGNRAEVRAAAAATLVRTHEELDRFDLLFRSYWDGELDTGTTVEQPADDSPGSAPEPEGELDTVERNRVTPREADDKDATETADPDQPSWSPGESLLHKDIGTMTDAELEQARQLVADLVRTLINYRSRRFAPGKSGPQPDFRRMFRRSAPYGEYATRLLFRRRREKKVRLVLLCDVSGSMQIGRASCRERVYVLV